MNDESSKLRAENLSRVVKNNGKPKTIIKDFSFEFDKAKIYTILGPSGAGKSSLLRLFNRLDELSSGSIFYNGEDIRDFHPCLLRRKIGYFFQAPYLFPGTVKENILYVNSELTDDSLESLLSLVSLEKSFLISNVETLSIGEKQRVALARLVAMNPEIILLDEPTSALDMGNAMIIEKLICELTSNKGKTAIVVTHLPEQALRLGGECIFLIDGKIIESGPSEQIISNPGTKEGRDFINRGQNDRNRA